MPPILDDILAQEHNKLFDKNINNIYRYFANIMPLIYKIDNFVNFKQHIRLLLNNVFNTLFKNISDDDKNISDDDNIYIKSIALLINQKIIETINSDHTQFKITKLIQLLKQTKFDDFKSKLPKAILNSNLLIDDIYHNYKVYTEQKIEIKDYDTLIQTYNYILLLYINYKIHNMPCKQSFSTLQDKKLLYHFICNNITQKINTYYFKSNTADDLDIINIINNVCINLYNELNTLIVIIKSASLIKYDINILSNLIYKCDLLELLLFNNNNNHTLSILSKIRYINSLNSLNTV